jgi:hypothetical protein
MPKKKSSKKSSHAHPLAGYTGKARIGGGSRAPQTGFARPGGAKKSKRKGSKKAPSPAQIESRLKFAAMAAARAAAGKHKTGKHVGAGKKVAKAVKRAEKKAEHHMDAAASKAYRKSARALRKHIGAKSYRGKGKFHGPELPPGVGTTEQRVHAMQTGVAIKKTLDAATHEAQVQAKKLARKLRNECRKELKAVKTEAEKALAAAKAAKAAAKHPHKAKPHKGKKRKAKKAKKWERDHINMKPHVLVTNERYPRKGKKRKGHKTPVHHPGVGPSMSRPSKPRPPMPPRMGGASQGKNIADEILHGARMKKKGINQSFWACAGPVRSGCGSTGHVVRGVRKHAHVDGIGEITRRLRPGPKEVVI